MKGTMSSQLLFAAFLAFLISFKPCLAGTACVCGPVVLKEAICKPNHYAAAINVTGPLTDIGSDLGVTIEVVKKIRFEAGQDGNYSTAYFWNSKGKGPGCALSTLIQENREYIVFGKEFTFGGLRLEPCAVIPSNHDYLQSQIQELMNTDLNC